MDKNEMKSRISFALRDPVLQQGFECICKENADLKIYNEKLYRLINAERKRQEECDDVHLRKIAELEKENAELKEQIEELEKRLEMSNKVYNDNLDYSHHIEELCMLRKMRIEDLEAQIEKMKCCGNCGKWENCEKDEMFSQDICGDWELWED